MLPLILCRERLERIQRILARKGGELPVRDFARTFSVWDWEIEQAAALGWVEIETRKPRTGRPSRVVRSVSKPEAAKLPPFRREIEKEISGRHWNFAFHSVYSAIRGGCSTIFCIQPYTDAYLRAFPAARSRRAAAASMSRLLRRPDVKAARAWFYSKVRQEVPQAERMPDTASGIWSRLREFGIWSAGPRITVVRQ